MDVVVGRFFMGIRTVLIFDADAVYDYQFFREYCEYLWKHRFTNAIMLYRGLSMSCSPFENHGVLNMTGLKLLKDLFFDKFKNVRKYVYQLAHIKRLPRTDVIDGKIVGIDGKFIEAMCRNTNASYAVFKLP